MQLNKYLALCGVASRRNATDRVAPYLAFVHAKIWDVTDDLREPTLDYDAFLARLARHGYRGPLSIEFMGSKDVMDMLPRCVALLKRCRDGRGGNPT